MIGLHGIGIGTERGISSEHNNYTRIVRGLVSRSVSPPAMLEWGPVGHVSSTPKRWESFAGSVRHLETAEPVTLHVFDLGAGQQGVRHESVIAEHREIESTGHVCFDRPHSLFGSMVAP